MFHKAKELEVLEPQNWKLTMPITILRAFDFEAIEVI